MEWWQALILGVVEGITEYLPVSSTGHLLVAERLMGIPQSEAADAFAISIQGGAIAAVLGLYRARVGQMVLGLAGRDPAGARLVANIVAAFLPALACGLLLEKPIKAYLFGGERWGLWPIVLAWLVGGIAILVVSAYRTRRRRERGAGYDLSELGWKAALLIGLCQCVAMWPGTSRSLVTIVGGVLVGMRLASAVEFSFLLGVVTLGAATCHDALKHHEIMLASYGPTALGIGFVAAWLAAALAVKWMVGYLNRHGLALFGWYRIAVALAVAVWLWMSAGGAV